MGRRTGLRLKYEAFNRGEFGKTADLVEQYLHKGSQVFIEGHLKFDQWTSQEGQKRTAIKVVLDNMQFLEPRADGGTGAPRGSAPRRQDASPPSPSGDYDPGNDPGDRSMDPPPPGAGEENIPF